MVFPVQPGDVHMAPPSQSDGRCHSTHGLQVTCVVCGVGTAPSVIVTT